ncbi:MAG: CoA ester lyase [Gammaproteobacteria bacterium]|nr:CoA ester lyase [Gammaproteobacteria bacterium]
MRSLLFVPGDSARKQEKALATDADALILDLEDSVDPAQLGAARDRVRALVGARTAGARPQLWVRVNAPASGLWQADLAHLFGLTGARAGRAARAPKRNGRGPDGIVLPKVSAAAEVVTVARALAVLEGRSGLERGATRLLVIATETPRGLLSLPEYPARLGRSAPVLARLAGLTWGAEDLGAALGALARSDLSGQPTFTFQFARTSCLLAAAALGVQAIDGVHTDFRDPAGLAAQLECARRDGFTGKLAIHPEQIAAINAAFAPTAAECEQARRVVAAFAAARGAGVVSRDGRMIDRPHLLQAQRILAAAAATAAAGPAAGAGAAAGVGVAATAGGEP